MSHFFIKNKAQYSGENLIMLPKLSEQINLRQWE